MNETTVKTINVSAPAAPVVVPGYELQERIGAGGYGEVWRAIAPGGVQKAVKIVYGGVDESRGIAELKSLERIKDARHPFLLVLERFDVVDGRLVIVTELADGSLKDRFEEFRSKGKPGIPRAELLEYLRDSADALDYMFEKHGLAHLDIKPENILLVGGRAKVADFGLTKDISRESMSMMSGLTPQFAAPEIFEGRATRQSDQYSLAIVYQILLTGQAPFNGRTAAQLTAQHLHSTPSLSSLPPSDRSAIARALSKKSTQRFETCREFVEELFERPTRRRSVEPKVDRRPGRERPSVAAEDVPAQITRRFGEAPPPAAQDRFLPPVRPESRPGTDVLVVGIGGVGRRILRRLDGSVRRVLVDVDTQTLNEVRREMGDRDTSVDPVAMPLSPSSEYRRESSKWLEWIDRRWLYNVPRSLQTEGIRPLGRLACLANEASIVEAFRGHLDAIASEESETLTVYFVGACSGGTASGAVADLASLARTAAGDRPIECRALLVHAKRQNSVNGDLADASTLSLLSELRRLEAERILDKDEGRDSDASLDAVHLVDSGDSGDEAEVERALDTAAVYLERSIAIANLESAPTSSEVPALGTIGYASLPGADDESIADLTARTVRDLCVRWAARLPPERSTELPEFAAGFLEKLGFHGPALRQDFDKLTEAASTRLDGVVAQLAATRGIGDATGRVSLLEECLASVDESIDESHPAHLWSVVRSDRRKHATRVAGDAVRSVVQLVERPGHRAAMSRGMVAALRAALAETRGAIAEFAAKAADQVEESRSRLTTDETASREYTTGRVRLAVGALLNESVEFVEGKLLEIDRTLEEMQKGFSAESNAGVTTGDGEPVAGPVLDELDRRVQAIVEGTGGRFGALLRDDPRKLATIVRDAARTLAVESLSTAAIRSVGEDGIAELVRRTFAEARPRLPVRGDVRLVLVAPTAALANALSPAGRGVTPTVVVDPTADPGVLWITSGVPYAHVARRFVGDRPTVLQLADRLHTRTDVNWHA